MRNKQITEKAVAVCCEITCLGNGVEEAHSLALLLGEAGDLWVPLRQLCTP